ncbi:hypothetical protein ACFFGT_10460 [Mucilaginibacter angelicae]|uniref:Uncharacterized protein n=1 Tax=Mucilaginibacter angelicae TaxID=869718 RepID=A0ABV6L5A9_9SPHI
MNSRQFGYILSSWISPSVLAEAIRKTIERPDIMNSVVDLDINSRYFNSGQSANLPFLVTLFLEGFHVPIELFKFVPMYLKNIADTPEETEMKNIHFTGTIDYLDNVLNIDGTYHIIRVTCPAKEMQLIRYPLIMLIDAVTNLAKYWSNLKITHSKNTVHHQHLSEWAFLSFIDIYVAKAYGFDGIADLRVSPLGMDYALDVQQREISCQGKIPVESNILSSLIFNAQIMINKNQS